MKKILGTFIVLSRVVSSAHAADAPVIAVSKNYVDSGLATKASSSALNVIVDSLSVNNTIAKANSALQSTQKAAANGVASLGADAKVPYAQMPVGTTANTIAAGNDSRFDTIPVGAPSGSPRAGRAFIWIEQ